VLIDLPPDEHYHAATVAALRHASEHAGSPIAGGSRLAELYGTLRAVERTNCSYGLAPEVQHIANEHGMQVTATDATGEVRAIERIDHPFFIATLYQPQLSSAPGAPHPVFAGLLAAARSHLQSH